MKCSFHKWHCPQSISHAVVSDSLRLHGLQPARLLCPWNSPGKNTGVGSHSLLPGIFLTQGSNPGFLHWRQIVHYLSHLGSPFWGWGGGAFVLPFGKNPTLTTELMVRATGGGAHGVHVLRSEAEKSFVTCFFKTVAVLNLKAKIGLYEHCTCDASSIVPGTLGRLFSFG